MLNFYKLFKDEPLLSIADIIGGNGFFVSKYAQNSKKNVVENV